MAWVLDRITEGGPPLHSTVFDMTLTHIRPSETLKEVAGVPGECRVPSGSFQVIQNHKRGSDKMEITKGVKEDASMVI